MPEDPISQTNKEGSEEEMEQGTPPIGNASQQFHLG